MKSLVPTNRPTSLRTKQGRGPRIFRLKRGNEYESVWRLRCRANGEDAFFKLGTDLAAAEKLAWSIHTRLQAGETPAKILQEQRYGPGAGDAKASTIGEVLETFMRAQGALELKTRTAIEYRKALLTIARVLGASAGKDLLTVEEASQLPISILGVGAMQRFQKEFMARGKFATPEDERRRKRTANAILRNGKAVFSKRAIEHYSELTLPDLTAFMAAPIFRKVVKKRRLPAELVIERILRDGHELKQDASAYTAYLLALHAGLRKGEIIACRRDWFTETAPWRIWVRADRDFTPKGTEGFVEITEWARGEILSHAPGVDYLLSGSATERAEDVFQRLNAWLRRKGLDELKPTHALRGLFGSYIASTQGLFVAQKFLRHEDAQITSDSYADVILSDSLKQLWRDGLNGAAKKLPGAGAKGGAL